MSKGSPSLSYDFCDKNKEREDYYTKLSET